MSSTEPDLAKIVRRAAEGAAAAEDPEWQKVAFARLLDHLLSDAPSPISANGIDPHGLSGPADAESPLGSPRQRSDEVAMFFGIDPERVGDVFELADEEPQLVLSQKHLGAKSAPATRKVALLVIGVRSALGLDTSTDHIRESAKRLHVIDPANFNGTLAKMPELALMGSPGAKSRPVRLKTAGVARARELVAELISE